MSIVRLSSGVELYYDEYGSGDNYVLWAQQFVNSSINYLKLLCEKYDFHGYVIRIRGYAPSSPITEDLGYEWYNVWAQDVCDFADAMGIDKFFYTGHSHGAGIGWHLCLNHPERLRGFFGSALGPHKKDGLETGGARMETINAAKSRETWEEYGVKMGKYCAKYFNVICEQQSEEAEAAREAYEQTLNFWINMDLKAAVMNPRKPFPLCTTEEMLAEIQSKICVPILMLGSSKDAISPPELMVRSLNNVQNAKLVIFKDADHVDLPFRYRNEYVEEIVTFCREQHLL